jgi:enoyl-CoA hydratase
VGVSGPFFRVERRGHVASITFDRPERHNALGPEFWDGMAAVVAAVDADLEVRVIVLSGAGASFTSGLDLARMAGVLPLSTGEPDGQQKRALHELIRRMQAAISAVERSRVPVIAAISGYCLGGGVDLITACDLRLCSADATFSVRETRLAMVPDVGTLQRLPAIVGPGRARELVYTGRDFGADEALRMGLVEQVLPDRATLDAAAAALADQIAANAPLAVQGSKRVLVEADRARVETGLEYVATWNAAYLDTRDLRTAFAAAATRTTPTFEGR